MKIVGSACSLLLLTMVAVSSGRNAAEYFQQAGFHTTPSRPEDAVVFFVGSAPPLICEPDKGDDEMGVERLKNDFRLDLPDGYSSYRCSFEGNATRNTNLYLIADSLPGLLDFTDGRKVRLNERRMYCTTDSKLPDEYFHMRIQRPHEDHPVKCRLYIDSGTVYVRFSGYPTIVCAFGGRVGKYFFKLPFIDDELECTFRVYSELLLGDTHTEERLYQSLISGLASHVGGVRALVCSHHATSNAIANFELELQGGAAYDCSFPEAAPSNLMEP